MNEIMNAKGIEITEENSWNWMNHPAKDGKHRWGRIRKELKIYSPSDWGCSATYATIGLEVNTWDKTIEVQFLKGSMPYVSNLIWALLADRDVRRLIAEYQESTRREQYRIWSTSGMSGREDVFMTFGRKIGGFATTKTMKLCHISCNGRLNEGFGDKEYNSVCFEIFENGKLIDKRYTKDVRFWAPYLRDRLEGKYEND
jgi:hypothetical protein